MTLETRTIFEINQYEADENFRNSFITLYDFLHSLPEGAKRYGVFVNMGTGEILTVEDIHTAIRVLSALSERGIWDFSH